MHIVLLKFKLIRFGNQYIGFYDERKILKHEYNALINKIVDLSYKLYHFIIIKKYKLRSDKILYNVFKNKASTKRALLVYYYIAIFNQEKDPLWRKHQNYQQCKIIAELLNKNGYIVDVVDLNSSSQPIIKKNYDLIIRHKRGKFTYHYENNPFLIYLSTGLPPVYHNLMLEKRYKYLFARHKVKMT